MRKIFLLFLLLVLFFSCNKDFKPKSIYIWNAQLSLNSTDYEFFSDNGINNLYIRLFDVVWENNEKPLSILNFSGVIPADFNVIPVVFIKNDIFYNIQNDNIEIFADKLLFKINEVYFDNFENHKYNEIQIDCDWTENTKEKFFSLLEILQKKIDENIKISVTIRLHQIKYKQSSGIPPADKGVLMYYNMGDITNPDEKNSIINNETGKKYINKNTNYPLDLSLALPVFSWSIRYNPDKSINVFYSLNSNNIDSISFLKKYNTYFYTVTKDTVIEQTYLRYGDKLKLEKVTAQNLIKAKKICQPVLNNNYEIIIYNYNKNNNKLLNKDSLSLFFY